VSRVTTATPRTLRAINDRAALALLLDRGPLSRSQLAELTGLSKPTAAQLLSRLSADGLVVERGRNSGLPGPSARLYAVNERVAYAAAVSVEEDGATAAVADITGAVRAEVVTVVDFTRKADPVPVVRRLVADTARRAGVRLADVRHVVLGVPAAYDPATDALDFAAHIPGWARPGVLARLRAALRPTLVVENDVNLAAVWERRYGVATDVPSFVLLWVGEGLGLSIDLGGRLYSGARGGAGEIGYIPVGWHGEGSGAVAETFDDIAGAPTVAALAKRYGFRGGAADAIATARRDLSRGLPLLSELARRLAVGLAPVVAVLDPPLVVLAGSTAVAGGEELVALIAQQLRAISPFDAPLRLTAATGSPVLGGGLHAALTRTREAVFGTGFQAGAERAAGEDVYGVRAGG
jgi:predicted NBD/HSP70 family sugar kinase/biotin operon repressor